MYYSQNKYIGFIDGTSHWLKNLASTAWAIYTPHQTLYHIGGVFMGVHMNNQEEYDTIYWSFV